MLWWLLASARAADCPAPAAQAELAVVLDAAEIGFVSLAPDVFADRLDEASLMLPCLSEVVRPSLAARWHGLRGLRLYTTGRADDARASFSSARAADPGWTLSETLIPAAHDVRRLLDAPAPSAPSPMDPPASGALFVDGSESAQRPAERPAIVQWVDGQTIGFTSYAWPGDALPPYPLDDRAHAASPQVARRERRRPRWAILVASGAAAGTSAALYGLGVAGQHRTLHAALTPDVDRADLESMQGRTNALVVSSGVTAVLAAGGLVTFAVVR